MNVESSPQEIWIRIRFLEKKPDPHHCLSDHLRIPIGSDLMCNKILNVRNLCVLLHTKAVPKLMCNLYTNNF